MKRLFRYLFLFSGIILDTGCRLWYNKIIREGILERIKADVMGIEMSGLLDAGLFILGVGFILGVPIGLAWFIGKAIGKGMGGKK